MLIKDLSKLIILDDVCPNAKAGEVFFVSHLLGNEALALPEDWPGRIYTSQFIFDVLHKKKLRISPKHFKIMRPNVPIKFKSKNKTILVTMFETEELSGSVMFLFEDGTTTHLYTGIFTEIGGLFRNEQFMSYVGLGISNVYVNCTGCSRSSYVFTDDTLRDIKQIISSHPDTQVAIVVPHFGYEKLLVELIKLFPQNVFPTKMQRLILTKLGFKDLLAKEPSSRIITCAPGITVDLIKSNQGITVYIVEGKTSSNHACGMYMCQWSPFPSLMDLHALLDIVRPKNIFSIRHKSLQDNIPLPSTLQWFTRKVKSKGNPQSSELSYSDVDNASAHSLSRTSNVNTTKQSENMDQVSMATTKIFIPPSRCLNTATSPQPGTSRKSIESVEQVRVQNAPSCRSNHMI